MQIDMKTDVDSTREREQQPFQEEVHSLGDAYVRFYQAC